MGRDGFALDADGDDVPGGTVTADFRTLPLTRIEGTDVFGYVFDSFNKNPDGTNIPIVGATIRVDAFPNANAVTDETGFFRLENLPTPAFSVHIDGSTATNAPERTVYPTVGKLFHSVPGQETQLTMNGENFDIFLPPLALDDIQELSLTENTDVGFGNTAKSELQEMFPDVDSAMWDLLQVTFPAGSAQDEEGNVATQATVIPVDPERLPAPLPPGLTPQLVISIQAGGENSFSQADGATNFDVPAPLAFPNLEGLAPGEKSSIFSFNHDSGQWESVGLGTVSEDGQAIVSDPGVGILAPGWHTPGPPPVEPPPPSLPFPCPELNNPSALAQCLSNAVEKYEDASNKCYLAFLACLRAASNPTICVAAFLAYEVCELIALKNFLEDLDKCRKRFCNGSPVSSVLAEANLGQFSEQNSEKFDQIVEQFEQIRLAIYPFVISGQEIDLEVLQKVENYIAQANELAGGNALGFIRSFLLEQEEDIALLQAELAGGDGNAPPYPIQYVAEIQRSSDIFVVRGQTESFGQYSLFVPRDGSIRYVSFYDPQTNEVGVALPTLSPDARYQVRRVNLVPVDDSFPDFDKDGLSDIVEDIYGTNPAIADTDGDGINDLAEIQQGIDPLNDRSFPTGIITSLPLFGEAKGVIVEGSTLNAEQQLAYVATGSHGFAIIDVSQFNNPIIQGQIDLSGDSVDVAVDANLQIAAVAAGSGGLHFVDVSDPMLPTLHRTININARQVEILDGVAYVSVGSMLQSYDLLTGDIIQHLSLGSSAITGLARESDMLLHNEQQPCFTGC